jgi:hypothetical protein
MREIDPIDRKGFVGRSDAKIEDLLATPANGDGLGEGPRLLGVFMMPSGMKLESAADI